MSYEFTSEEERHEFCAVMHERFKDAYESTGLYSRQVILSEKDDLFRMMRVLEDIYYPNKHIKKWKE